ncbi:MAG: ABC transporter substrate-binding protein [Nitrospinae bacterium]|nr:ABC transporter substrate-binding protein [Nitrospinota bacterium]
MKRLVGFALAAAFVASTFVVATPAESAKLRIGAHRALMGSFEVISHRMGYWKKEGLKYTMSHFKQGKLMRNAIIQNNLDTGTTGFSPFTTAISKGAKVTAIGVTANICGMVAIIVPAKSKAKSLKDLKGSVFANKKGTSTDFAFQFYVVPAHGLKRSDFPLLSVRTTERIAALVSGAAQAAMVGEPQGEIAREQGLIRYLEDLCKYDNTRMMHVGNPQTLKKHPDLYYRYFRGWLKAHQLLKNDPETYAKVYTKALQEVGDKAKVSTTLKVVKKLKTEVFLSDEVKKYLNDMGDKQIQLGWIKSRPDFTKSPHLDDSILRRAAKDIGFN